MTANVGALGISILIIASPTFPQGFNITEYSGDGDPLTIGDIEVSQTEMGVNGDMLAWNRAVPIAVELGAIIPNSEADKNLEILLNSNRAAKNKVAIQNDITMVITYQDGSTKTLTGGVIKSGSPANSATSDSRLKSKTYTFDFQNIV